MLFRWANERGLNSMPTPEVLELEGWVRVHRHPFWPSSYLMRRDMECEAEEWTSASLGPRTGADEGA